MSGWEAYEKALEELGADELCNALAQAMSDDELLENIEYISREHDLDLFDEDDEEEEEEEDDEDLDESRRLRRGRMLREGLLSQEREDSTNKQKNEKAALERAAKVVEILKALDKEHGYTFGVRNTKTEDAAKMLITGEAQIPFDQDDRKVLRALYNGLNKFCATVRKHTFVLKKDCFYDEAKFNELIDFLS